MMNKYHDIIVGLEQCIFVSKQEIQALHLINTLPSGEKLLMKLTILGISIITDTGENDCFKAIDYSHNLSHKSPVCIIRGPTKAKCIFLKEVDLRTFTQHIGLPRWLSG